MYAAPRCALRATNATKSIAKAEKRSGVVARASTSDKRAVTTTTTTLTALTMMSHAGAAHAGQVSDRLAAALDAADSAADAATAIFSQAADLVAQGVELAQEAAPVVLPVAERAVKAVAPVGEAFGAYAGRAIVPAAGEALKQASSASGQALSSADSALKAQGVDVAPAAKIVEEGAQIVFDAAVPIAQQIADYLANASGEELATTAGELFLAYLLAPVVFKLAADIARGYRGDLRPIEAYDMLLSENAVIVDTRGSEVTVQLPGGANKRVLVCGIEKSGAFSNSATGKVAALKIASLRGVSRGKKVILLDQNGGSAKVLAKALAKQGFSKVFTVRGGYNSWSRSGLATTDR